MIRFITATVGLLLALLPAGVSAQNINIKISGLSDSRSTSENIFGASEENASLLKSERTGMDFRYVFTGLPSNEPVQVELGFTELRHRSPGQRIFNVEINNKRALSSFDLIAQSGGPRRAVIRRFAITPRRGYLDIHFQGVLGEATVSYIRLKGSNLDVTAGPDVTPSVSPFQRSIGDPESGEIRVDSSRATWDCGVPFGGMGTGKFEILPNGEFANFTINNNWDMPIRRAGGTFIAVAAKAVSGGGTTRILRAAPPVNVSVGGERQFLACTYRGAFPFADWKFDDPKFPLDVSMSSFSSLIPQNERDSALPCAFVSITFHNPNSHPVSASVAFSFEDINGKGGSANSGDQHPLASQLIHADAGTSGVSGVIMTSEMPAVGRRATFQGQYFVGCETSGVVVTRSLHWDPRAGDPPWMKQLAKSGRLLKRPPRGAYWSSIGKTVNSSAAVVCASLNLAPREKRTVPFVIAWHMPRIVTLTGSGTEEAVDYATSFTSALAVAQYAAANRERLYAETSQWHDMISRSNLPRTIKTRLFNSLFPVVTNSVHLSGGKYSNLESAGDMAGLLGAADLRRSLQPFLCAMFPKLDAAELTFFARAQQPDGRIPRYIGNIHGAIPDSHASLLSVIWPDVTSCWVQQAAYHAELTDNDAFRNEIAPHVGKAMQFLQDADLDDDTLPDGGHMLEPEVASDALDLGIGVNYLAALRAAERLTGESGTTASASQLNERFRQVSSATACLIPGTADRAGCRTDAPTSVTYSFTTAGDAHLRAAGFAPLLDEDALTAVLDTIIGKNISAFKPLPAMTVGSGGQSLSRFSYLGMFEPSLAAELFRCGRPDEAMDIITRLADFQYKQSKDTWQSALAYDMPDGVKPAIRSHITAAGTWSLLHAVSGVAVDWKSRTLFFDPQLPRSMNGELHAPVFTPGFWGWIAYDNESSTGTLAVKKVFPGFEERTLEKLARGRARDGSLIHEMTLPLPFALREGEVWELDNR